MMDDKLSFVLVPQEAGLMQRLIDLATTHFGQDSLGYLINSNSIPHISLLQLTCKGGWPTELKPKACRQIIRFDSFHYKAHAQNAKTSWWAEFTVVKEPMLQALHEACYAKHTLFDSRIHNLHGSHFAPHLSLAQVGARQELDSNIFADFLHRDISCALKLGYNDALWQLTGFVT